MVVIKSLNTKAAVGLVERRNPWAVTQGKRSLKMPGLVDLGDGDYRMCSRFEGFDDQLSGRRW